MFPKALTFLMISAAVAVKAPTPRPAIEQLNKLPSSPLVAPQRAERHWSRPDPLEVIQVQLTSSSVELDPPGTGDPSAINVDSLWRWRLLLLGITISWGANFAVIKLALDTLGDTAESGSLFMAGRFGLAALLLAPFLGGSSSPAAVRAGLSVGGLCAFGYAAQATSLAMGTAAGTSAFVCSLQAVVVALIVASRSGGVPLQTWIAIGLAVAGVGCLELPSVLHSGSFGLADLVAFGQPLGFGASYVVLEEAQAASEEDDSLALAALQCLVIGAASLAAASFAAGTSPVALPWTSLLPQSEAPTQLAAWAVPGALLYTGVISTALTIWLQARVFAALPAVEASLILTTEPLWAALVALALLGDRVGPTDCVGGALIIGALGVSQGVVPIPSVDPQPDERDVA